MEVKTLKEVLELNLMQDVRCLTLNFGTLKGERPYNNGREPRELLFSIILDKEEGFPTCLDYNHVEVFIISDYNITALPQSMNNLKRLMILTGKNINSMANMYKNLDSLELKSCPNIKSLPVHCPKLKSLSVQNCQNLKWLPGSYIDLEKLYVHSKGIKELPKYNALKLFSSYDSDLIEQAKLLPSIKYINNKAV